MANPKSRLLAATKLSDYHQKKIIRSYADGVTASEAARNSSLSYHTVRRTYDLIRQRMLDLGIYKSLDRFLREKDEGEQQGPYWQDRPFFDYLKESLGKRRGVTDANRDLHTAELIYRFERAERWGEDSVSGFHYAEILKLIRLGGPLNRPLTKSGRSRVFEFVIARGMDELRRTELKMDADFARLMKEMEDEPGDDEDDEPNDQNS